MDVLRVRIILLFIVTISSANASNSTEYSVQLSAIVSNNPPKIILHWVSDQSASAYHIYKREARKGAGWGLEIGKTNGTVNSFSDSNVKAGIIYEYKVEKIDKNPGYGYLASGIEIPATNDRGVLILVVENSFKDDVAFSDAISQTIEDIEMDGWRVIRRDVNRNDAVTAVKEKIRSAYSLDPQNTHALYLIGNVPVPYSGLINPDGHGDHLGAWPADVYYADLTGKWTDKSVNSTVAKDKRNNNIPGDGKFDQSYIPDVVKLETGRIDFSRQFKFNQSEKELLISYLQKAHKYKTGQIIAQEQGILDDNFTDKSEPFASSGYRNLAAFLGADKINTNADFIQAAKIDGGLSYLWAYGCGGGSWQSCGGVANTDELLKNPIQTIFTLLFGSYFGDWDSDNNLMVATIAQGLTLTTAWAGRPQWHLYHMGIGKNIGFGALLTQNNKNDYYPGTSDTHARKVHIALLGDPSLRMHYLSPPDGLTANYENRLVKLKWTLDDNIAGYNIYRKKQTENRYTLLNNRLVKDNFYVDNGINESGIVNYILKAVRLQETGSGSYYNESLGIQKNVNVQISNDDSLNHKNVKFILLNKNDDLAVNQAVIKTIYGQNVSGIDGQVQVQQVANGWFSFTIEHNEYFIIQDSAYIANDTSLTIRLMPKYSRIEFRVKNSFGPLESASVSLNGYRQGTNDQGIVVFQDQPSKEEYIYIIEKSDYLTKTDTIFLQLDTIVNVNLTSDLQLNLSSISKKGFSIYPNPVTDRINIIIENNDVGYSLIHPKGKILTHGQLSKGVNQINVEKLPPGIYFLRLANSESIIVQKIIIQ